MQTVEPMHSRFAGAPEAVSCEVETQLEAVAAERNAVLHQLHTDPETAFNEHRSAAVVVALLGLAQTALDYLCDERLRQAVAEEFAAQGRPMDMLQYLD